MEAQTIIQYILEYSNQWYLWPALGIVLALGFWAALSFRVKAHARGLGKLGYLIMPWNPKRMLIIDRTVYYDDEYKVVKGEDSYHINTDDGLHYTSKVDPDEVAVIHSSLNVRGPQGIDSPFSLAWRWIVSGTMVLYTATMGLLQAWMDPRLTVFKWLKVFGYSVPIDVYAQVANNRADNVVIAGILAAIIGAWWLANLTKLTTPGIRVSKFVSLSGTNGVTHIVPAVDPDTPSNVFNVLKQLSVKIEIPEDLKKIVQRIADKMGEDTTALVQVLNKAALADMWRKEIGSLDKHYLDVKRAAEAECLLKAKGLTPRLVTSIGKLAAIMLISGLVIGGLIGYGIGAVYGTPQVQHNTTTTTTTPAGGGQGGYTTPVHIGNTTVTPAPMPTPPVGGVKGG